MTYSTDLTKIIFTFATKKKAQNNTCKSCDMEISKSSGRQPILYTNYSIKEEDLQ